MVHQCVCVCGRLYSVLGKQICKQNKYPKKKRKEFYELLGIATHNNHHHHYHYYYHLDKLTVLFMCVCARVWVFVSYQNKFSGFFFLFSSNLSVMMASGLIIQSATSCLTNLCVCVLCCKCMRISCLF